MESLIDFVKERLSEAPPSAAEMAMEAARERMEAVTERFLERHMDSL